MRLLILSLVAGCSVEVHEGDDAGECADGADNDLDGAFDCDDSECGGSPDCSTATDPDPGTTDTTTDPGTTDPSTTGPDPVALSDYQSYAVTMQVDWVFPTDFAPDCTLVYEGSGAQVEATPSRITFDGPYTLTSTTCTDHDLFQSAFPWYDKVEETALVSFKFTDDLGTLDEWYADPSEKMQSCRSTPAAACATPR